MIEFIETSLFSKAVNAYMNDDEYASLQWYLNQVPEAGDLIPGSGGLRKLRWKAKGRGKSGGSRIIYYYKLKNNEIWMITIYNKNEVESVPGHVLKQIKKEFVG